VSSCGCFRWPLVPVLRLEVRPATHFCPRATGGRASGRMSRGVRPRRFVASVVRSPVRSVARPRKEPQHCCKFDTCGHLFPREDGDKVAMQQLQAQLVGDMKAGFCNLIPLIQRSRLWVTWTFRQTPMIASIRRSFRTRLPDSARSASIGYLLGRGICYIVHHEPGRGAVSYATADSGPSARQLRRGWWGCGLP
jgi:hypothetical protein